VLAYASVRQQQTRSLYQLRNKSLCKKNETPGQGIGPNKEYSEASLQNYRSFKRKPGPTRLQNLEIRDNSGMKPTTSATSPTSETWSRNFILEAQLKELQEVIKSLTMQVSGLQDQMKSQVQLFATMLRGNPTTAQSTNSAPTLAQPNQQPNAPNKATAPYTEQPKNQTKTYASVAKSRASNKNGCVTG
jgi:hypothetical protein